MTRALFYINTRYPHVRPARRAYTDMVRSDYLYAYPRFLDGFASVVDVWGSPCRYNYSESDEEADLRALWADWAVVGKSLKTAMDTCELKLAHEHEHERTDDEQGSDLVPAGHDR